jgi:LacI family transcriptional regulator
MISKWVTQRDIAQKASVHITTVSLALRNHPSIPPVTRDKIQKLAQELGYCPNPGLSSLIAYRRAIKPIRTDSVIGYLTSWKTADEWKSDFCYVDFYESAKKRALELGYKFEHFWLRAPGLTSKRWNRIFQTRNLAGLILAPLPLGRGHLRLDWTGFCAVKIDPSLVWPPLHCITNNQLEAMRLAIRHAYRHGYRRMGLAMKLSANEHVNRYWSASFLDEQARRPNLAQIPMCMPQQWQESTFIKWVKKHKPDVVLSFHLKIEGWLKNAGLQIPKDIGFIDLDCSDLSGKRAGINQQHKEVGTTAIDTLVTLMQNNEKGLPATPRTILMGNSWIEGKTIRTLDPKKPGALIRTK